MGNYCTQSCSSVLGGDAFESVLTAEIVTSRFGGGASLSTPDEEPQTRRRAVDPRKTATTPFYDAEITRVQTLTRNVRELTLRVEGDLATFQPGSWVDFKIPKVEQVGGYSITSLPAELPFITVAVKKDTDRPALWCHSSYCVAGARVQVAVGSSSFAEMAAALPEDSKVLLIAGGIGITPIAGVAKHIQATTKNRSSILYSAKTQDDMAYLEDLQTKVDCADIATFATAEAELDATNGSRRAAAKRISLADVRQAVLDMGCAANGGSASQTPSSSVVALHMLCSSMASFPPTKDLHVFISGPPEMADTLSQALIRGHEDLGFRVPKDKVVVDRWW